jgi:hypothetical protein
MAGARSLFRMAPRAPPTALDSSAEIIDDTPEGSPAYVRKVTLIKIYRYRYRLM